MQTAETVAEFLREKYGGTRIYVSSRNGETREKVRREFDGRNIPELAAKYGLSAQTIRNYLKK